jgi:hypothetical protein
MRGGDLISRLNGEEVKLLVPFAAAILVVFTGCDSITGPAEDARDYRVGEILLFNVQFEAGALCSSSAADLRQGSVVAISERAIIVVDKQNPEGGFTDDEYRAYAEAFDARVWPAMAGTFGEPHDIDQNHRVVIFFTRAVNELTPPGQDWYVGGVFAARDLFPVEGNRRLGGCAGSNQAEMLYMLVPDPHGEVNGNVRRKSSELHRTVNVMAHELQHLINASRRLYGGGAVGSDWMEEVWLNEGLSQVAEELMGYATSDLGPRQNIDLDRLISSESGQRAMSLHFYDNFHNLGHYLRAPSSAAIYGPDELATRGATWQFLRYAADRRGGTESAFWRNLVDSGRRGLDNLQAAIGGNPADWLHDWHISAYVDGLLPTIEVRYTQPSWDFRNLYPRLRGPDGMAYGSYPLAVTELLDGRQENISITAGGAAYLSFTAPVGGVAEIQLENASSSCTTLRMAVGEVVKLSESEVAAICLEGGAGGAAFVYIPFYAAETGSRQLTVTASGLASTTSSETTAQTTKLADRHQRGHSHRSPDWELRFRQQERDELARLIPGASSALAPSYSISSGTQGELRIAIVRTK